MSLIGLSLFSLLSGCKSGDEECPIDLEVLEKGREPHPTRIIPFEAGTYTLEPHLEKFVRDTAHQLIQLGMPSEKVCSYKFRLVEEISVKDINSAGAHHNGTIYLDAEDKYWPLFTGFEWRERIAHEICHSLQENYISPSENRLFKVIHNEKMKFFSFDNFLDRTPTYTNIRDDIYGTTNVKEDFAVDCSMFFIAHQSFEIQAQDSNPLQKSLDYFNNTLTYRPEPVEIPWSQQEIQISQILNDSRSVSQIDPNTGSLITYSDGRISVNSLENGELIFQTSCYCHHSWSIELLHYFNNRVYIFAVDNTRESNNRLMIESVDESGARETVFDFYQYRTREQAPEFDTKKNIINCGRKRPSFSLYKTDHDDSWYWESVDLQRNIALVRRQNIDYNESFYVVPLDDPEAMEEIEHPINSNGRVLETGSMWIFPEDEKLVTVDKETLEAKNQWIPEMMYDGKYLIWDDLVLIIGEASYLDPRVLAVLYSPESELFHPVEQSLFETLPSWMNSVSDSSFTETYTNQNGDLFLLPTSDPRISSSVQKVIHWK